MNRRRFQGRLRGQIGRGMAEKGKAKRALEVTMVARRTYLLRVLPEVGVVGGKQATREGAIRFREALEELGPTFVKLGQRVDRTDPRSPAEERA